MRPRTAKYGSEADLAFALHFTEGFLLDYSIISQETIAAYEATHFRVLGEPTFVLKIGQPSAPLRQLYKEYGCTSATFITAWNPRSVRTSDANNTAAQTQLERDLTERSIPFIAGIGKDPAGQWPGEPSVLALGLSRDAAMAIGVRFQQNAIVWASIDANPQLVLLR